MSSFLSSIHQRFDDAVNVEQDWASEKEAEGAPDLPQETRVVTDEVLPVVLELEVLKPQVNDPVRAVVHPLLPAGHLFEKTIQCYFDLTINWNRLVEAMEDTVRI